MSTASKNSAAVLLFGPTGVGKTDLLLEHFPPQTQVVSVDSVQVYRGLDIGSSKPSLQTRQKIPHHLIDILDPSQSFDVGDFVSQANLAVEAILSDGGLPCLSGGTAFYFQNWVWGLPQTPVSDVAIRQIVREKWETEGELRFRADLATIDPQSEAKIQPRDSYRLQRAWEVWIQTGRPLSSFSRQANKQERLLFIAGLDRPREDLYRRIDQRVLSMVHEGLEEEVRRLLDLSGGRPFPSLKAIGYREWLPWLNDNKGSRDAVIEQIARNTRHYAKRQITFFRSLPDVRWYHPDDQDKLLSDLSQWSLTNGLGWC